MKANLPPGMALRLQEEWGITDWYEVKCPTCGRVWAVQSDPKVREETCPECWVKELEEWNRQYMQQKGEGE